MNNTKQKTDSYHNAWHFIEEYLPNYSRRDDVLTNDILFRYLEGEDVCSDDMAMIDSEFHDEKKLIIQELIRMESGFMAEALNEFYSSKLYIKDK